MRLGVQPFPFSYAGRGAARLEAREFLQRFEQPRRDDARQVAQEFEALLLEQLVGEMRKSVPQSNLLGHERQQELFREMLDGEYVRLITQHGGIGIAEMMMQHLPRAKGADGAGPASAQDSAARADTQASGLSADGARRASRPEGPRT